MELEDAFPISQISIDYRDAGLDVSTQTCAMLYLIAAADNSIVGAPYGGDAALWSGRQVDTPGGGLAVRAFTTVQYECIASYVDGSRVNELETAPTPLMDAIMAARQGEAPIVHIFDPGQLLPLSREDCVWQAESATRLAAAEVMRFSFHNF